MTAVIGYRGVTLLTGNDNDEPGRSIPAAAADAGRTDADDAMARTSPQWWENPAVQSTSSLRRQHRTTITALALVGLVLVAACSDATGSGDGTTGDVGSSTQAPPPLTPADQSLLAAVQASVDHDPEGCDPLDTTRCLLPFPSDVYTVADERTDTGRRVSLPADGMPQNSDGVRIDPGEWNRSDGFSPNTPILAYIPGVDDLATALPSWTDIGVSMGETSTVVMIDLDTGDRIPLWAELDAHADEAMDRLLTIRPAISLPEGHTFVVGLRGMLDAQRGYIPPSPVFRVYRDALSTGIDSIERRRPEMERAIGALVAGGVTRSDLQLAWSFTVASTRSTTERMLHIRDEGLARIGDKAPAFTISSIESGEVTDADDDVALRIRGTFEVPNYLTGDGTAGNGFAYDVDPGDDPDALPVQNGTIDVVFQCNVSERTMAGTEPAHLVLYGHGLLGSETEIDAGNVRAMAAEHNVVFCATKWAGMSEDDVLNAIEALSDMNNFPTVADRLQQGVLHQMYLGRLMTEFNGLSSVETLRRNDGGELFDTTHLDYDGNSQGGIMGLMLTAVSPDIERSVLGVPGMNYSLLLPRSVDFDTYEQVFEPAYPNDLDRVLILGLVQMLWDRGEGAGYVQHITADPLPGTPTKQVLLHVAYGDHQVTPLAAFVAARTLGATVHRPVAGPSRWPELEEGWGLASTVYPSTGSAVIMWDSGMAPIPIENLAPRSGDDSHEDPRADPDVRIQKAAFLFDDVLVDVCGAAPCTADHVG